MLLELVLDAQALKRVAGRVGGLDVFEPAHQLDERIVGDNLLLLLPLIGGRFVGHLGSKDTFLNLTRLSCAQTSNRAALSAGFRGYRTAHNISGFRLLHLLSPWQQWRPFSCPGVTLQSV